MPVKINGYSRVKINAKRDRKRREAEERQERYDALPIAEKLKTMGKRQLARYQRQQAALAKKPAPVVAAVVPAVEVKPVEKKKYQKAKKS